MPKRAVRKKLRSMLRRRVYTSAVILAAGSSLRFGAEAKQFALIDSIPVVAYSLIAFQKSRQADEIIVVCRDGEQPLYDKMAADYGIDKYKCAVCGGATRQLSALKGVEATSRTAKYVAIHDAARPLVTTDIIRDVAFAAQEYRAACAACPSTDTVKLSDDNGAISKTLDRDKIYLAQTPQIFYKPLYEACAYSAVRDGAEVTDDASLLEHYFYKVKLVNCGNENFKITRPCDLYCASAVIMHRKEEENEEKQKSQKQSGR